MNTTPQARPRVLIVATGGTIAGSSAAATGHRYTAGVLNISDLTNAIGPIGNDIDLTAKQVFSIDSTEMTLADRITIAHTIHTELTNATHQGTPYNGVVVTHGTDTLEDTAFCLHHLLPAQTPIVITGAMLPADAPGADGPANLTDAITIAASPHAHGCGTLVAFAGRIHTGRDVTKHSASRIDAFTSDHGPIGETVGGRPYRLTPPPTPAGQIPITQLPQTLPRVDVAIGLPENAPTNRAIINTAPDGLIYIGPGSGNIDTANADILKQASNNGIKIVRTSRTGGGITDHNGAINDTEHNWIAGADHPWHKARILLTLALAHNPTATTTELQHLFNHS